MKKNTGFALFAVLATPLSALAHAAGQSGGGFLDGLQHPVLGYDHLLAMLCVGILSIRFGSAAAFLIPSVFVLVMVAGALLGIRGVPFLPVEVGIAISVVVLGLAMAWLTRLRFAFVLGMAAFFAVFHGYAHGIEMPESGGLISYISGFTLGTAVIHMAGVLIGYVFKINPAGRMIERIAGGMIALAGFYYLI